MLRRSFLVGMGGLAVPALAQGQPFPLGIASGCPRPTSIVLWTRLTAPGPVAWAIAEDEGMRRVVRNGTATAEERWANSVHVDVEGLRPGRHYWYRFTANGEASPVGRTRTAPAPTDKPQALRFAIASCAQYEQGYFAAYRHMAAEELDAVLFVGDYIYEMSWGRDLVRRHNGGRCTLLFEYRDRYAQYKSDADLQAAHLAHPWILTWDDHEVANDYTDDIGPEDSDPARFLRQRAAAYQAYWEHMPLPNALRPGGPSMRLYDRYRFGTLAELVTLDDRQYRSHHACRETLKRGKALENCAERLDPNRTMLGAEQEAWLADAMHRASARWNVIAQQTLMAELDRGPGERHVYWADGWDGYPAARRRLLDAVAASPVKNTLVLGGDVHSFWAADLKQDFARPQSATVATEFVGGSITSQGPAPDRVHGYLAKNPHIRAAASGVFGFGVVALDAKKADVSFRTLADVRDPKSTIGIHERFVVEAGRPGVVRD
ncbi:MAG TPA: alkaline phosphatase D family protein [Reyranella sp.]|jgi:alkaline phosphatase D|nr:alkaline phosphatase D family protein [Reyranella sp.]